jgi:hypothetical protein
LAFAYVDEWTGGFESLSHRGIESLSHRGITLSIPQKYIKENLLDEKHRDFKQGQ